MTTLYGPRIGVALGGGAARGLAHIPIIEAMDEMGLKPSLIAGTSIGAFIGAGWAFGMSGREIREHALDVLGSTRALSSRLWKTQVYDIREMFQNGISMQFDALRVLGAFSPKPFPRRFRNLKIPLRVIATDYRSWHPAVFHEGRLDKALAGSIAIPSLFKPVIHEGRMLVDGGVVNPLPLDYASQDMDIVIGVDVNGDPLLTDPSLTPSTIDIGMGAAQIMMHALTAQTLGAYPPDIYVKPNVRNIDAYEFWRVREALAAGDEVKDRFKAQLTEKIDIFIAAQGRTAEAG
ncbi:patatin-like phospholipase family protein [Maritalea sp.]|jgi:NTE family protein|uniref:patatin-like phospholipase family protein n=1 Tax=Maritalea sp. TaxID=2003361 RepID=UPI0039E531A9